MKKIILLSIFAFTLAHSQGYEFRTSIHPKTSHNLNLGDATHYWSTAYLDSMYGFVKFQNYPFLYRGAVLGQDGAFDGVLRFDKINHQRGYLGTNALTGYRNWKFPDTSGTVALLDTVFAIMRGHIDSLADGVRTQFSELDLSPTRIRMAVSDSMFDALNGRINSHGSEMTLYDSLISISVSKVEYDAFGDTLYTWASGVKSTVDNLYLYALRDDIVSYINLYPDSIKISSSHLFIDAPTIFRAINGDTSNYTSIDGGKIRAKSITSLGAVMAGSFSISSPNHVFEVDTLGGLRADSATFNNVVITGSLLTNSYQETPHLNAPTITGGTLQIGRRTDDTTLYNFNVDSDGNMIARTGTFTGSITGSTFESDNNYGDVVNISNGIITFTGTYGTTTMYGGGAFNISTGVTAPTFSGAWAGEQIGDAYIESASTWNAKANAFTGATTNLSLLGSDGLTTVLVTIVNGIITEATLE